MLFKPGAEYVAHVNPDADLSDGVMCDDYLNYMWKAITLPSEVYNLTSAGAGVADIGANVVNASA